MYIDPSDLQSPYSVPQFLNTLPQGHLYPLPSLEAANDILVILPGLIAVPSDLAEQFQKFLDEAEDS